MPQQRPFLLQQIKLAGGVKSKNGSLLIMQRGAAAAAAAAVSLLTQKLAIWYELMYERWAPSLISPVRTPREGRRSEWEARFSRFVESFLSFAVKFVCPPVRRGKKKFVWCLSLVQTIHWCHRRGLFFILKHVWVYFLLMWNPNSICNLWPERHIEVSYCFWQVCVEIHIKRIVIDWERMQLKG